MLLKAALPAYSQNAISSRAIERAFHDEVLFITLTGDAEPHFIIIAECAIRLHETIVISNEYARPSWIMLAHDIACDTHVRLRHQKNPSH